MNGATGAYLGGSASSAWYPGGNHWRGHHSTLWRNRDPNHLYTTPGWGGPWFYTPRTYYEPYRPQPVMPAPIEPGIASGPPEPWTAQWYAYCSNRFRSFEPSTGFYTTYSGNRRMCW